MSNNNISYSELPIFLPSFICDERIHWKIRLAFYLYTCHGKKYKEIWYFDDWQVSDIMFVVDPDTKEVMLLRNRGGSKSRDATVIAVWLGYGRNATNGLNRIVWFSASETQLDQVLKYFKENRYVDRNKSTNQKIVLWNGNIIDIRIMSPKQAVSKRADVIFYDEEQSMEEKPYEDSRGVLVGGLQKIIHLGTTEVGSILHRNFERLSLNGLVKEHHVDECSWTTVEKELNGSFAGAPQWKIDSQLFCKWTTPEGKVFPNIMIMELDLNEWNKVDSYYYYGIDPNPKDGHTVVRATYLTKKRKQSTDVIETVIYIDYEYIENDSELFSEKVIQLANEVNGMKKHFELEQNGSGDEWVKMLHLKERLCGRYVNNSSSNLTMISWAEQNKIQRVFRTRIYRIYFHPNCKNTYKHFSEALWNPTDPKGKVLKQSHQHFLDAGLHACALDSNNSNSFTVG